MGLLPEPFRRTLPTEYLALLAAVVDCLATDDETPLQTAEGMIAWLHDVFPQAIQRVITGDSDYPLLARVVRCVLERTHDSRLADWTPGQIADWCHRTRLRDVETALGLDKIA